MAKKILGAIVSPVSTLLGINPLFPKKKPPAAAAPLTPATPARKPAFTPIITPLGGSLAAPSRSPLNQPYGTILSDKLGG